MYDKFNIKITSLRISVTDRCNLRCTYCMPAEGIKLKTHADILSYNEITEFVKYAVETGVNKVRITGGEPLVRKNIVQLVDQISKIEGIKDFGMTTNGVLLKQYAADLKKAGLHRINISLDSVNPERFNKITRLGNLNDVFEGIEAAKKAGLLPIKINCVIQNSPLEEDAVQVAEFCKNNDLKIRYIREMDLEKGRFHKVIGGTGGECSMCNRLRLTSDGKIRPCLFSELQYDIRELGIKTALMLAIGNKPEEGSTNKELHFNEIGG